MSTAKRLWSFTAVSISRSRSTCTTSTAGALDCVSDAPNPTMAKSIRSMAPSEASSRSLWLIYIYLPTCELCPSPHRDHRPKHGIHATLEDVEQRPISFLVCHIPSRGPLSDPQTFSRRCWEVVIAGVWG